MGVSLNAAGTLPAQRPADQESGPTRSRDPSTRLTAGSMRDQETAGAGPIFAMIDSLVLSGFRPLDTNRVQAAFATELEARLRQVGPAIATWASHHPEFSPPVRMQLGPTFGPEELGREIARAVFLSLSAQTIDER